MQFITVPRPGGLLGAEGEAEKWYRHHFISFFLGGMVPLGGYTMFSNTIQICSHVLRGMGGMRTGRYT